MHRFLALKARLDYVSINNEDVGVYMFGKITKDIEERISTFLEVSREYEITIDHYSCKHIFKKHGDKKEAMRG